MTLTKRGERHLGIAFVVGLLAMLGIAGYVETQPNPATDAECDSMYHAVMILDGNPAQITLIETAWDMGCPFDDGDGNYLYEWQPLTD